jgi:phage tail-like protein
MILHVNKKTLGILLAAGCLLGAPNRRPHDHIGNFNFKVEIEGVTAGRFKNVEGMDSETEVIEYQDGEDRILRKRPGRVKYANITLKRGYVNTDEFWAWRKAVLGGTDAKKTGALVLQNDKGEEIARYPFYGAWPCKWKGWNLDGKGTDNVVEEIELAVEKIERAPVQAGK